MQKVLYEHRKDAEEVESVNEEDLAASKREEAAAREKQRGQLRDLFRWVDADSGGSISAAELTKAVSNGPKCLLRDRPLKVLRLFQVLDEDGSGELGAWTRCCSATALRVCRGCAAMYSRACHMTMGVQTRRRGRMGGEHPQV